MRYIFHLGHPAHFHLFKIIISNLRSKGHECKILIKKKDILEDLLQKSNINYTNVLPLGRSDSKIGIAKGLIKTDLRLFQFARKFKPDVMIGTSYAISHVGKLLNIPSININEDDADVVPLYSKLSYPWASCILTPEVTNVGKWGNKKISYQGYHELAYLHPTHFIADKQVVAKYFNPEETFFVIRFAKLTAHHDDGIRGISNTIAKELIQMLESKGKVYVTSEKPLPFELEKYRMAINPLDIHHVMAYAKLYIGDSQTMAAEAGVLGTPFIRFNDFVGRIGYLNELENVYHLGFGIKSNEEEKLFTTVVRLINTPKLKEEWQSRRQKMLSEKIDVAAFMTWFIEDYPKSVKIMKVNPEYQYTFK
jgi:predicted glycosyltransferase